MATETLSIAIVGGGQTGTSLLELLLKADFLNIVGVADLDDNATGIKLAEKNGVRTTNNFLDLLAGGDVDIVIEVTGVAQVRELLRNHMQDTDNKRTVIMHEKIARLLWSLSAGSLVYMKHTDEGYQRRRLLFCDN